MNKNEFMKELSRNLSNVPEEEKQDISTDYDEYFVIGIEQGRSEENIALSLGEPKTIAKQLRANYMIEKAQSTKSSRNIGRAVIAAVGLGFFNIILLGPFIAIVGILIGLYATAFGFTIGGIGIVLGTFLKPIFPQYISMGVNWIISIAIGIGLSSAGSLMFIGCKHLSKWLYKETIKYLKTNIKIINGKEEQNHERI
ncbi:DUF1700 domain-containing protein [Clostridium tagluense]|uniref:HAAS signaling domain-containing protein n=1 Tax=Clostridium tagluense TaxID=360422 RepID=UPI001CF19969|nr:DUF1700 domain-containing protein [Clostridium tagluense]MCB2312244.1 DUF1700 domain-containing protein [Clostridium tagluense]MCB2316831.1 DUF1700 domain-containing protein [Clostridium tagluense]MCB2321692.1 DUF1700 domain-containing protein [Clostridium tagluense]MCB2326700.1 DUF1700 domain-containing protein [Clostridium tagluense]MCB2331423.1 DUF1700 domain-containing protein [Clostridium tagluense]